VNESFDTGVYADMITRERPKFVETPFGAMALHRIGEEFLAAQAFCPHLDGPLYEGTLSGEDIVCPWHQWRYNLRTGHRILLGLITRGNGSGLLVCDVSLSPRGTLVLANPRRG
jgi:nitrite reductase/ring-hydroxylating ferredoxin subunit